MSLYGTLKNLGPLDLEKKMKWGGGGQRSGRKEEGLLFSFQVRNPVL